MHISKILKFELPCDFWSLKRDSDMYQKIPYKWLLLQAVLMKLSWTDSCILDWLWQRNKHRKIGLEHSSELQAVTSEDLEDTSFGLRLPFGLGRNACYRNGDLLSECHLPPSLLKTVQQSCSCSVVIRRMSVSHYLFFLARRFRFPTYKHTQWKMGRLRVPRSKGSHTWQRHECWKDRVCFQD